MTDTDNKPPHLDPELLDFIRSPVSMNLATVNAAQRPAVSRVFGCRVEEDGVSLTLFLTANGNAELLENVRANGRVAVVFSRPSTHRTVQLKGRDAHLVAPGGTAPALAAAYRKAMTDELGGLGFPALFTRGLIPPPEDIDIAIRFTPLVAYSQTPGPGAGGRIRS